MPAHWIGSRMSDTDDTKFKLEKTCDSYRYMLYINQDNLYRVYRWYMYTIDNIEYTRLLPEQPGGFDLYDIFIMPTANIMDHLAGYVSYSRDRTIDSISKAYRYKDKILTESRILSNYRIYVHRTQSEVLRNAGMFTMSFYNKLSNSNKQRLWFMLKKIYKEEYKINITASSMFPEFRHNREATDVQR